MANRDYIVLGQVDHQDLKLGEVRAVVLPPESEELVVKSKETVQVFKPEKGTYYSKVIVDSVALDKPNQSKTTIPTKERQVVKADLGYELAENIIEPIPDEYADITGVTASAEDVLNGKVFVDNQGNEVQGTAELKEDLDAELTAQDEAITRLTVAVDSLPEEKGEKEIVIELPEEFANSSVFYTFRFNDDKILICSDRPNDIGVWQYSISDNVITQLYSKRNWKNFQMVEDKCLITSGSSGVLLYDGSTITQLYSGGSDLQYFQVIGDRCLIGGGMYSKGVLLYHNDAITELYMNGYQWENFKMVGDVCLISGGSSSNADAGILLYDGITVTKIYELGKDWKFYQQVGDKWLISCSSANKGILLYDGVTITELYADGYYWRYFQVIGDKCLISSSSSLGVLLYDGDTITQLYSSGTYWQHFQVIGDKCLISSDNNSTKGILLYDGVTITQLYVDGFRWKYFQVIGDKCLIGGMSGASGVLLFDGTTISQLYKYGYEWSEFYVVGNKCLISSNSTNSSSNSGILLYDSDTISLLYSNGYGWEFIATNNDGTILMSSTNTKFLIVYNPADNSIKTTGFKVKV